MPPPGMPGMPKEEEPKAESSEAVKDSIPEPESKKEQKVVEMVTVVEGPDGQTSQQIDPIKCEDGDRLVVKIMVKNQLGKEVAVEKEI